MLKIEMDEIIIDTKELEFDAIKDDIQAELSTVLADHSRKAQSSKAPDGSSQKQNTEPYRSRKRTRGIRQGSRTQRGSVPTILSGDMMGSRQIKSNSREVSAFYSGRLNAVKARSLVNKGYRIHFFSKKNKEAIEKRALEAIDLRSLIKTRKK